MLIPCWGSYLTWPKVIKIKTNQKLPAYLIFNFSVLNKAYWGKTPRYLNLNSLFSIGLILLSLNRILSIHWYISHFLSGKKKLELDHFRNFIFRIRRSMCPKKNQIREPKLLNIGRFPLKSKKQKYSLDSIHSYRYFFLKREGSNHP